MTTEAVFDVDGSMVWLKFADEFSQAGHRICCLPASETAIWSGWGNPVHYDCTDGTVYTPADFPDSADTGAPTTTGETADTGATCR